ncbi:hypothetical protein OPKNFCMD_3821 [Methylobacterium crusticola]|uniref:DUF4376 domain-containing protein n=1 Tax=Methylobacterium crusticola TaxID=1697972 RepID=A0ABQ4R294_9HYPH|nr:DUF4376 domain-containing protein [Methylobacterium crusticola]GJD51070.1 hypothetical protein OPKNFCMD_3821 [Methylobacterium crusticola]
MTYAIISQDRVVGLAPTEPDLPRSIEVQDVSGVLGIEIGWSRQDGAWVAPELPAADLVARAGARRQRAENAGVAFAAAGGSRWHSDRASVARMMADRISALTDATRTALWHDADGASRALSARDVMAVTDAINAHLRACADAYKAAVDGIEAGAIKTSAGIAAVSWPA